MEESLIDVVEKKQKVGNHGEGSKVQRILRELVGGPLLLFVKLRHSVTDTR